MEVGGKWPEGTFQSSRRNIRMEKGTCFASWHDVLDQFNVFFHTNITTIRENLDAKPLEAPDNLPSVLPIEDPIPGGIKVKYFQDTYLKLCAETDDEVFYEILSPLLTWLLKLLSHWNKGFFLAHWRKLGWPCYSKNPCKTTKMNWQRNNLHLINTTFITDGKQWFYSISQLSLFLIENISESLPGKPCYYSRVAPK